MIRACFLGLLALLSLVSCTGLSAPDQLQQLFATKNGATATYGFLTASGPGDIWGNPGTGLEHFDGSSWHPVTLEGALAAAIAQPLSDFATGGMGFHPLGDAVGAATVSGSAGQLWGTVTGTSVFAVSPNGTIVDHTSEVGSPAAGSTILLAAFEDTVAVSVTPDQGTSTLYTLTSGKFQKAAAQPPIQIKGLRVTPDGFVWALDTPENSVQVARFDGHVWTMIPGASDLSFTWVSSTDAWDAATGGTSVKGTFATQTPLTMTHFDGTSFTVGSPLKLPADWTSDTSHNYACTGVVVSLGGGRVGILSERSAVDQTIINAELIVNPVNGSTIGGSTNVFHDVCTTTCMYADPGVRMFYGQEGIVLWNGLGVILMGSVTAS